MRKVILSEEANEEITSLLKCIIDSNAVNPEVDGIYMKEYDFCGMEYATIELVLIVKDESFPLEEIRKFYSKNIKTILNKFGIDIMIGAVLSEYLAYFPEMTFSGMDTLDIVFRYDICRSLMNGRIVYDPEDKYENLKLKMISAYDKDSLAYENLIEFVPPIKLERKKPS